MRKNRGGARSRVYANYFHRNFLESFFFNRLYPVRVWDICLRRMG